MSGPELASSPQTQPDAGDTAGDAAGDTAGDTAGDIEAAIGASTDGPADDTDGTEPELPESEETGRGPAKSSRATATDLVREGDVAADYLESLLDILDLDGDLDMDVEGERAVVAIVGKGLGSLIGEKGQTLESLQELTRLAVQREMGVRSRLMLDIGGFRARRRAELSDLGASVATRVAENGEPERLSAMSPFERKVVHDAVASVAGVHSESEGEEPQRRVVVLPG
jgi:spoIIIJ-associated protein